MAGWVTLPSTKAIGLLLAALLAGIAFSQERLPARAELLETRRLEINAKRSALEMRRLAKKPERVAEAQTAFDVTYYRINLHIFPDADSLSGTVEVRAAVTKDSLEAVVLDLYDNLTVDGVSGDAADFSGGNNLLTIQLPQSYHQGDSLAFLVAYHGRPAGDGFGSFGVNYHGDSPIIWTLSEPYGARAWWPCKDAPSDKADSVDMIVTVPQGLTVASNGVLRSQVDNGDGTSTFHWHEGYPITTYLVSLAITNYATYSEWFRHAPDDSMEVRYYLYPEDSDSLRGLLTETLDMLDYFHDTFGPYPFLTEKYGIAQFPWGGGMEHQTITSQGSFGLALTVHELAHQWWGDKITCANWHEIWLNEGFASYAEALYFEHAYGKKYFQGYMESMMYYHYQHGAHYPYPIYVDDTTSAGRIFDHTVYDKGGWFLHMLRHIVGDSTFFDILLAYSNDPRFAYGNATTAGFQDVCETQSGMDLDWFFEPWIYEAGRPEYLATWSTTDAAGTPLLHLHIEQTQVPEQALFPMPIDVTVATDQGDTVITVFNDQAMQDWTIPLAANPTGIILDKDGWILKKVVSVAPIPTEFALRQNYPNPFNLDTHLRYAVPRTSRVKLVIYDLLGREVTTLVDDTRDQGWYTATWRGQDSKGRPVASGIYLYRIEIRDPSDGGLNFTQTRKLLLLK